LLPSVVSTLFPQLPRASMLGYRLALVGGVAAVVVLELVRLFPVAVVAAALLVPVLILLYLFDVEIYEDEPLRAVALTVVWGALAGIGVGLLGRYVSPTGLLTVAESTAKRVLVRGLGIPLLSTALMLAGPLILLPYRKFNETLDGAIFGAACGATFVGAQVLAQSTDLFSAGLRPAGQEYPRVVYLLEFAVAMPVIAAGTIGAAAGALWLRYRAPARDRNALGLLGHPSVAVPLAAGFMIAAAFILLYVSSRTVALVLLLVLAALALLWLRQVIHVGLLEEAAEIEIGPDITCANCGHTTPRHTFCINCGISLKALPKISPRRAARSTPRLETQE
jgi:RsiW-degrading membrane proteinase PrsW (M82 family)